MKNALNVCVIGKGPLGLNVARNLYDMGHCVTVIDSNGKGYRSAAKNNLGIAISGMRFFWQGVKRLDRIVESYRLGRVGIEKILKVRLQHYGSDVAHGLFSFGTKDKFDLFQNCLDSVNINKEDYASILAEEGMEMLGERFQIKREYFSKSPEIPFSQYNYLTTLDEFSFRNEIRLKSVNDLALRSCDEKKAGVEIIANGSRLEDFDYVFIAAGRFIEPIANQLGLDTEIVPEVKCYYSARFPDDRTFKGSVYYDFPSEFTIARHKRQNKIREFCLMVNCGFPTRQIFDPESEDVEISNVEKEAYLSKIKTIYDFTCASSKIKIRRCYLTDFGKRSTSSDNIVSRHQAPFIYYNPTAFKGVVIGSCYRATLAFDTALEMLSKVKITTVNSPKKKCLQTSSPHRKNLKRHQTLVEEEE